LADAGHRVLLISTDPVSNLDEVLETELASEPRKFAGVPGLVAMNIDPNEAAAAYRERIIGPYRGVLPDTAVAYNREVSRNTSELSADVRQLLPRLRDPAFTKVLVVTLPEATPVHEAAFLQEDLRRAGIEPWAWVINQSFQGLESSDPMIKSKQYHEQNYLREVATRLSHRTACIQFAPERAGSARP